MFDQSELGHLAQRRPLQLPVPARFEVCLREHRVVRGRTVEIYPPLFAGYAFVLIELQWHTAGWAPGTNGLVMSGDLPVRVPHAVIAGLRAREVDGYVELSKPRGLRRGDRPDRKLSRAAHRRRRALGLAVLVLFAVFFWALLWGIAGAFIGVPIVIAALTLCEQRDSTRWVATLLSGANGSHDGALGLIGLRSARGVQLRRERW